MNGKPQRYKGTENAEMSSRWHHPNGRNQRISKEPLDEGEREEWKSWLKTQHSKKLRSWNPVPSLHGKLMDKNGNSDRLFSWTPESLGTVTVAMKLKDACSLDWTDAEAETPILWPPHAKRWLVGKDPDAVRDWGQEEKGMTEDEMAGWHHWLDGHEFE